MFNLNIPLSFVMLNIFVRKSALHNCISNQNHLVILDYIRIAKFNILKHLAETMN